MPTTLDAPPAPAFTPAATLDEVVARLDDIIHRARGENSRVGYFACLYRSVTVRVGKGIDDGEFQDGPRMERLDVAFANRYLAALDAYQRGVPLTRSWRVAFDAAAGSDLLILQHLLLGIHAHINLDLGIAAAEVAPGVSLAAMQHDFAMITGVLAEMINDVQERLARVSPWMGVLDWIGMRNDEQIVNFALGQSRDASWRTAQRLAPLSGAALAKEVDELDRLVAVLANPIRKPAIWLRPILMAVRLREPNDVARVLDALT